MIKKGFKFVLIILFIWWINCGKEKPNIPDPKVLIRHGEYENALKAAEDWASIEPTNLDRIVMVGVARASLFASQLTTGSIGEEGLANPFSSSQGHVVIDSNKVSLVLKDIEKGKSIASMPQLLSLFIEDALSVTAFESPVFFDFLTEVVAKAIGSLSLEPTQKREVTPLLFELIAYGVAHNARLETLRSLWNVAEYLLSNNVIFPDKEQHNAWKSYLALARIVILVKDKELKLAAGELAVSIVENNPFLVIAVRCDLASPYEELIKALYWERKLKERLEHAVREAEGCTPGTYAPQVVK